MCPFKERRYEQEAQRVLYGMELCPYAHGGALHKSLLLLEGLLHAHIGGLQVLARHPVHDFHQSLPSLHILL